MSGSNATIQLAGAPTPVDAAALACGDALSYTGVVYTARDAAHKRLLELIGTGAELPFELKGAVIYYAGPAPARPGEPIGPVGPTSSYRMDAATPALLDRGVRMLIGKGVRSSKVVDALVRNQALYCAAVGGAALVMARSVRTAELVAFPELGTEAIRKLEVVDMPLVVAIDARGHSIYEEGPAAWRMAQVNGYDQYMDRPGGIR